MYISLSVFVFSSDALDWKIFSTIYLMIEIIFAIIQRTLKNANIDVDSFFLDLLELIIYHLYHLLSHAGYVISVYF